LRRNPESVEELIYGKGPAIPARSWPCFSGHEKSPSMHAPPQKRADPRKRFNLKAMMAAKICSVRDHSEARLAQDYFAPLSRYYAEAAAAGNAMLLGVV